MIWNDVWVWGSGTFWQGATPSEPVYYDYGDNITYDDETGMVYINGVPYVSAEEYYRQGKALADEGADTSLLLGDDESASSSTPAATDTIDTHNQWLPLGSFAVLSDEQQTTSHVVMQLAMNKHGVIRGNIYNQVTDKVQQIEGAVDKETQRVAFRISGDDEHIAECGLWNLTQDSLVLLIHGKPREGEKTAPQALTRTLIRLNDEGTGTP